MRNNYLYSLTLLAFSALPLVALPAHALSKVTFLGANPKYIDPSPVAIANLAGGGIDAAGNGYFVDGNAGTVVKSTPEGNVKTLLSGLKQPHVAVDYRGNIFIADSGHNRVLTLAAGATEPVVRVNISSPGSIAVDASSNAFFLSGNELYEVIYGGSIRKIGAFPGASLLAYGPASGENDTMYVLENQAPAPAIGAAAQYSVATYTYHNATGTIAAGKTFKTADKIEDFGVDAAGNLIFAAIKAPAGSSQQKTYLFEVTPDGDDLPLTAPVSGSTIHLALDHNRSIYYTDAQGIFEIMKGAIDFGTASQGAGGEPNTLTLNFSLPTGVAVASTSYNVDGTYSGDFEDGFPFDANCSAGSAVCSMPVSYLPADLGITAATLSLLDADGNILSQVRLHGVGMYPMHELFTDHEVARPDPPTSLSIKAPVGICTTTSLGPLMTDTALGSIFTPYSTAFQVGSLGKPQTVAHLPAGNTYATQDSTAGVLAIHPDMTMNRVGQRLATEPNGVGVDGAGNLYVSDHNSVFRIGVDGTETQLASPATDDGYESVQSIAVDASGDVYAFFAQGGPAGNGGLLKITPAGTSTAVPVDAASAAGLALDSGGGLYFSDVANKSLETLRTDGTWITLLTGVGKPKGVTALYGPLLVDQASAQLLAPTLLQSAFDFGNVPVGTTVTKSFTVFALGNAQTKGYLSFDGMDSAFNTGANYTIDPGGSQKVTITFSPSYAGPHSSTLYDEANDYFSEEPIVQQYAVTGVGIEPAVKR